MYVHACTHTGSCCLATGLVCHPQWPQCQKRFSFLQAAYFVTRFFHTNYCKGRKTHVSYLCLYQCCHLHKYLPYFPYRIFCFQNLFMSCFYICQGKLGFQGICNNLDKWCVFVTLCMANICVCAPRARSSQMCPYPLLWYLHCLQTLPPRLSLTDSPVRHLWLLCQLCKRNRRMFIALCVYLTSR